MKMTNEERECFFAQYWGQEVCKFNPSVSVLNWKVDANMIDNCEKLYLELRTVQMLSDEELKYMDIFDNESEYQRMQVDYLRQIGVLVGFRHFTPEMLIAEGVVKVKEL
jgi:hypothetical protein